jgi:hypothetical protein
MNTRQGLALACTALAGLVWWLAAGEDGLPRAGVRAAPSLAGTERVATELRAAEGPVVDGASVLPATRAVDSPSAFESAPRRALDAAPAPVVVRVQLALASGEPGVFAGWSVEAQSWIEATNETFPHATTANAAGTAEFRFPGFVHVDWVRCVPPPESGLALAFSDPHADLDPGERWEETLALEPGGTALGRVVDEDGGPVPGVRVHAYASHSWELFEWTPGIAWAVTGADGRFELPPLPPETWGLGVEPDAWLQIDPEPGATRSSREVEVGQRVDGEDLRVVPIERFRVRLLDGADAAVPGAELTLAPLELAAGLTPRHPTKLEIFLGRAAAPESPEAPLVWPFGELEWTTDERGEAELVALAGRWELEVAPPLAVQGSASAPFRTELQVPCPDPALRVPTALAELRARVVDPEGRPIGNVYLELSRPKGRSLESRTARDGTFVLRGVPPGSDYRLRLSHQEYRAAQWPLALVASTEFPDFVLRRAGRVRLLLVDPGGVPLAEHTLAVRSVRPAEPPSAPEAAWAHGPELPSGATDEEGRIEFAPFPPGEVEVALLLPFVAGASSDGQKLVNEPFRTWVVPVQAEEQRLVADLAGYAPPPKTVAFVHTGVVVDDSSGEPLAGATVALRSARGFTQARSNEEGRFRMFWAPGTHALSVLQPGYLPLAVPEQEWAAGEHEQRFALQRGAAELELEIVDRDGVRLPRVDVFLTDEGGERVLACGSVNGAVRLVRGVVQAVPGHTVFAALPPGRLHLELKIEGHALGQASLEVGGTAPREATIRLERSLEEMRRTIERALAERGE